ncbi:hypothetical protein [Arcanobacterium canis]
MDFHQGTEPWQDATSCENIMRQARWYRGNDPHVRFGPWARAGNTSASIILQLVQSEGLVYQLPLYLTAPTAADHDFLGYIGPAGNLSVFDATEHPFGREAIYEAILGDVTWEGSLPVSTHTLRGNSAQLPRVAESHKLASEQSNTSVIYTFATRACHKDSSTTGNAENTSAPEDVGIIIKMFRVIDFGKNPDVELMEGLEKLGTRAIPRQYGSIFADADGHIDLGVAAEFLADSVDAWQVLTAQAISSPELVDRSQIVELGSMTRNIHHDLRQAFSTTPVTDDVKAQLRHVWQERLEQAVHDAPQLHTAQKAIESVFDSALAGQWPHLSRIHGDLHLGQVLRSPERGWIALDFEGEPLRSLESRQLPDLPLRDVAGMLRSFDYVAGATGVGEQWAAQARAAFLEGYGPVESQELLDALELDKALYEVSYEAASRPDWIHIPLSGVEKLLRGK